jgi:pilus assembly protein CpaB
MQLRSLLIVGFALLCGGAAAVGVSVFGAPKAGASQEMLIMTAMDIPRGQTIEADMVRARPYPKELAPPGVLTKIEDVVGRATLVPLVKDEPVLDTKLAVKGSGRGLAALIPKGMRAMTIQTPNVATGVAGFILPGNRVDVLVTLTDTAVDLRNNTTSSTVLENVEILAVDQKIDAPAENKTDYKEMRSVTLLVTPSQQTRLNLAMNKGTLHLSLRNAGDSRPAVAPSSTMTDLKEPAGKKPTWDERLKAALAEYAKAQQARQREAARAARTAAPPAPPAAPPVLRIRTLRGVHEGEIRLGRLDVRGS